MGMNKTLWPVVLLVLVLNCGCAGPEEYLIKADNAAYSIIAQKMVETGEGSAAEGEFEISGAGSVKEQLRQRLLRQQRLPSLENPTFVASAVDYSQPLELSLLKALQVAAYNNRDYQLNKEKVFRQALALDLQREVFASSFNGLLSTMWSTKKSGSERIGGLHYGANGSWKHKFKSGVAFAASIGFDLVQLLTANRVSARGIIADASISVPLMRGAGEQIATEPLQQAELNVVYALWDFERYRRSFAVQIASEYLLVLEWMNRVVTAHDNYQRLVASRQRAERLADAGRLPQVQVGQALQDELRARSSWVSAQQDSADRLDRFKIMLGLPTDSVVTLNLNQLEENSQITLPDDGEFEKQVPESLVTTALLERRDLRVARGRVVDSRRAVLVAEDQLRADISLLGSGKAGSSRSLASVDSNNTGLDLDHGLYSALLTVDLPIERTAERNALRSCWLDWGERKRSLQELEDSIKYQIRSAWRGWREAYELIKIQTQALKVARRRVASTDLFLRAGRIQMRDLLEAQDALVSARNALVAAQVQYRIRVLELKRDIGTLDIDPAGGWLKDVIAYDDVAQK